MNLSDKCKEWWPRMCIAGRTHTSSLSAGQIYGGTTRPDLWIAVAALVAYEEILDDDGDVVIARTDDAKQLMLDVLQDAAGLHENGEIKARIMALKLSDNEAKKASNLLWARQKRNAARGKVEGDQLERAYHSMIEWLANPDNPKGVQIPFAHVVSYRMEAEGTDLATTRQNVYAYMRSQMDESTFKGTYT